MRIYKSFFRFEKCRKACKYRLYRLMRTYKEIVKNYILISCEKTRIFGFRGLPYNNAPSVQTAHPKNKGPKDHSLPSLCAVRQCRTHRRHTPKNSLSEPKGKTNDAGHHERQRNLKCRPHHHADPGGNADVAGHLEVALRNEFPDKGADQGHKKNPENAHK